ncbi:MAG: tyrosinase family protein [Bacteroidota bacterium]
MMKIVSHIKKIGLLVLLLAFTHSIFAQCDGRRKDVVNDLSPTEREDLRDLIMDYLNVGFDPFATGVNQYPNVAVHSINPFNFHNYAEEFLTWHRAYIAGLEQYILEQGETQFLPLPKWNPMDPIPTEFFNGTSVLPGSAFPSLINQDPSSVSSYDFSTFTNDVTLCNFSNIDAMAGSLESEHDFVHGAIGGSMGSVATASGTAIFWLWHAWVDDVYHCYQELCQGLSSDLWSADDGSDVAAEPYPKSVMWVSDDIWVRNTNDGFQNQTHENPEYVSGGSVYVYIKVRNNGAMPNEDGVGTVNLYWAKASTNLSWTFPWTGANFPNPINLPAGGPIGSQPLRSINQDYTDVYDINQNGNITEVLSDFTIYEFAWSPPNPDDYQPFVNQIGNGSHEHFCLLGRIVEPGGMTFPETTALGSNVNNNNNIVWKNISLKNDIAGLIGDDPDCVFVGNFDRIPMEDAGFLVVFPTEKDATLLDVADVHFTASPGLGEMIRRVRPVGFDNLRNGTLALTDREASITGLEFAPQQMEAICLQIIPRVQTTATFNLDLIQTQRGQTVGGERYTITIGRAVKDRNSEEEQTISIQKQISEPISIFPNPAKDFVTIQALDFGPKQARIFDHSGKLMKMLRFDQVTTNVDISDLTTGFYLIEVTNLVSQQAKTLKLIVE